MPGRPHRSPTQQGIALNQSIPAPGWYPDPAGSGGVRWWDGVGWTEHVALPEADPEPEAEPLGTLHFLETGSRRPAATLADDGRLHPRARDVVFAGAMRGPVAPLRERFRPSVQALTSLRGMQVSGMLAFTAFCWFIAVRGVLDDGGGIVPGICLCLGVALPIVAKVMVEVQVTTEFWRQWAASRGMESAVGNAASERLPANLNRSPLLGALEERAVELVATRELCGRRAWIGSLVRLTAPPDDDDPRCAPSLHRLTFVVMSIPEVPAARWKGASIRADHHARRPLVQRAMVGALVAGVVAEGRAHLAVAAGQEPTTLQRLVDPRLDAYLAEHPMDVDIVGDLLVVTRDGAPAECEALEELCRDALLLHELLVAEHELPVLLPGASAASGPAAEEPVIDLSRDGWGDGGTQQYQAAA